MPPPGAAPPDPAGAAPADAPPAPPPEGAPVAIEEEEGGPVPEAPESDAGAAHAEEDPPGVDGKKKGGLLGRLRSAKDEAKGTVYYVEEGDVPPPAVIPHDPPAVDQSVFQGFGKVYLWRVVDREMVRGLGALVGPATERVLVVTAAFIIISGVDGTAHRMTRLQHLDYVATQTRVKRGGHTTEVLVLKFTPEAAEPSLILHLKYSPLNPGPLDAGKCLRAIAAARQVHTQQPLRVEQFGPDVALKGVKRLGPFTKEKGAYRSPAQKMEAWGAFDEEDENGDAADEPLVVKRPFHVQDDEAEATLREVLFTPPSMKGGSAGKRAAAAPLARSFPSAIKNLEVGDGVRVKATPSDLYWRFGTVVGFDHGDAIVSVDRDAPPACYTLVQPVHTRGVYTVVRPTYITNAKGQPRGDDAHEVPEGKKLKVSGLCDHDGACWAQVPSGGWTPLQVGGAVYLEYHGELERHEQLANTRFGLNPAVYATAVPPAVDRELEKVPQSDPSPPASPAFPPTPLSPRAAAYPLPDIGAMPAGGPGGAVADAPVVVMVRVRPLLPGEAANPDLHAGEAGTNEVAVKNDAFGFDRVLWSAPRPGGGQPVCTQAELLETLAPTPIQALFAGYNASVLAYGASGSGKTYTILGEGTQEGLLQRALHTILAGARQAQREIEGCEIKVSFFELYAEKFKDLLAAADADASAASAAAATAPDPPGSKWSLSGLTGRHAAPAAVQPPPPAAFRKLKIRVHPITGHYVEGVVQVDATRGDLFALLDRAKATRATAATHGNSLSSRSHAIVQISLVRKVFNPGTGEGEVKASTLSIVDLAGSERARRYRDDNMAGASAINLSLTVLRKVIDSLLTQRADSKPGAAVRPPYRESMLTFLLSESLGGNAVTTIIATVSPAAAAMEDTIATLRYASRARRIVNRVKVRSVEEAAASLEQHQSPQIARALRDQYEALARRLGDAQKAGDARELWHMIRGSADGSKALAEVLLAVRQRERDEIFQQYGMRGGGDAGGRVGKLCPAAPEHESPPRGGYAEAPSPDLLWHSPPTHIQVAYAASPTSTTPPLRGAGYSHSPPAREEYYPLEAQAPGMLSPMPQSEADTAPCGADDAAPPAGNLSPPPRTAPSLEAIVRAVSAERPGGGDARAASNDVLVEQLVRVLASSAHRMLSPSLERASLSPAPAPQETAAPPPPPEHPVSPPTEHRPSPPPPPVRERLECLPLAPPAPVVAASPVEAPGVTSVTSAASWMTARPSASWSYIDPSSACLHLPVTAMVRDYKSAPAAPPGQRVSSAQPAVMDAAIQAVPQQTTETQTSPDGGRRAAAVAEENPVLAALERYGSAAVTTTSSPRGTPQPAKASTAVDATNIMRYSNTIDVVSNLLQSAGYDRLDVPRSALQSNGVEESPSARLGAAGRRSRTAPGSAPPTPRAAQTQSVASTSVVISPLTPVGASHSPPDGRGEAVPPPPEEAAPAPPGRMGFVDLGRPGAADSAAGAAEAEPLLSRPRHLREEAEALRQKLLKVSATARQSSSSGAPPVTEPPATPPDPLSARPVFYSEHRASAYHSYHAAAPPAPAPAPPSAPDVFFTSVPSVAPPPPRAPLQVPPPPSFVIPSMTYAKLPVGRGPAGDAPMTTAMRLRMERSMQQHQPPSHRLR